MKDAKSKMTPPLSKEELDDALSPKYDSVKDPEGVVDC
jgi:hypothetical protein